MKKIMKKNLFIGLTLLVSMNSFALTVSDVNANLSQKICSENVDQSSRDFTNIISIANSAYTDFNDIVIAEFDLNKRVSESTIVARQKLGNHIDNLISSSMRNWPSESVSEEMVESLNILCNDL